MCGEVFEIVKNMDLFDVEVRLVLQCAPVITGIKMSNLLTVSSEDKEQVSKILDGTGIQYYCLYQQEKKSIYFLFQRLELEEYLQEVKIIAVFKIFGYNEMSLTRIFQIFKERYIGYMQQGKEFPHEMGILLGYPLEDVEGFIKNKGKNYLYAGYWKVYENVEEKRLLFDAYESAKEGLVMLVANGYALRPMIEFFRDNGYCSFLNT